MTRSFFKVFLINSVCGSLIFAAACGGNQSESYDVLNFSDDTSAAAALVASANEDLNKIKIIYKQNETKRDDLKNALKENNAEEVRQTADDLVHVINDGKGSADSAIEKIEKAEAMNINPDFKEYLSLKAEGLHRQIDAFENYRQAARFLRDSYNPNDEKQREKVKAEFTARNAEAQKILQTAREYSQKANDLAKEKSRNTN